MIRALSPMLVACAVTGRVTPSVTVDQNGKVGAQVVVGVGLAIYAKNPGEHQRRAGELGFAVGGTSNVKSTIVEGTLDYFWLPDSDDGFGARLGGRFGARFPTLDGGSSPTWGSIGAAAAAFWRISSRGDDSLYAHLLGVETRCDYAGDGTTSLGLCAFGPSYEIIHPFFDGFGGPF